MKYPQVAFPGEIMVHEPPAVRSFDAGNIGPWVEETLSSWGWA